MELAMESESLFGSVTELENGDVRVEFSNGPSILTREEYSRYQGRIESANAFYRERAEKERTTPCQDKRFLQILYTIYNREFEDIAKGLSENVRAFQEITITDEAYKKSNLIASRMYKIGGDNEIYLHLLNDSEKRAEGDFTSRDVYIPSEQIVTPVTCSLKSPAAKMRDAEEIRQSGKYISGWAHSHSQMTTFHSGTDKNNLLTEVLNGTPLKIAPNPFGTERVGEYSFRFLPSLVFNARGDNPSSAIAVDYPQFVIGKGLVMNTYINFSPKLNIIDEKNSISLDVSFIDETIKQRVRLSERTHGPSVPGKTLIDSLDGKSPEKGNVFRPFRRLAVLEEQYEQLYKQFEKLEEENSSLRKRVEGLEAILMEAE